jgi:hypothetical protein
MTDFDSAETMSAPFLARKLPRIVSSNLVGSIGWYRRETFV